MLAEKRIALPLAVLVLGIFTLALKTLNGSLLSAPACIYGCDIHHEMGVLLDIINSPGNLWQSSSHDWIGYMNNFPKGTAFLRLLFFEASGLPHFDAWKAVLFSSYALLALGFSGWYLLYSLIFGRRLENVLLAAVSVHFPAAPYFKYSSLIHVFLPLLLISYTLLLDRERCRGFQPKVAIFLLASCATAWVSNLHPMAFFVAYIFLGAAVLLFTFKGDGTGKTAGLAGASFPVAAGAGVFALSMALNVLAGWWPRLLTEYRGVEVMSKFGDWPAIDTAAKYFSFTGRYLREIFFSFDDPLRAFMSLTALFGTAVIVRERSWGTSKLYTTWFVGGFFFSVFNYLLTIPLLGRQLSPHHASSFLRPLFTATMLSLLLEMFGRHLRNRRWRVTALVVLTLAFAFLSSRQTMGKLDERFWMKGREPIPARYRALQEWFLIEGRSPSDTILLSTNELSFAAHGFTGAKLLTGRKAHFFLFGDRERDFQTVWMDAAVMLYGQDEGERRKTLRSYLSLARKAGKKLYLYWDPDWMISEWIKSERGVRPFDPFRFEYSPEREATLRKNGVLFRTVRDAVFDPASQRNPNIPRLTLIYVTPDNYRSPSRPWAAGLDRHLEEVWHHEKDGTVRARLFEITIDEGEQAGERGAYIEAAKGLLGRELQNVFDRELQVLSRHVVVDGEPYEAFADILRHRTVTLPPTEFPAHR